MKQLAFTRFEPGADPLLDRLAAAKLLPIFVKGDILVALPADVESAHRIAACMYAAEGDEVSRLRRTELGRRTLRDFGQPGTKSATWTELSSAGRAAVRNLADASSTSTANLDAWNAIPYVDRFTLETRSRQVIRIAEEQQLRLQKAQSFKASDFVQTAQYMGSKRRLASFLIEAISSYVKANGPVVDLMCGSGAASSAFAQQWNTIASDAQAFCRLLAQIQSRGFSVDRARKVLDQLRPHASSHLQQLKKTLAVPLALEQRLLHEAPGEALLMRYAEFVKQYGPYTTAPDWGMWAPLDAVEKRRSGVEKAPYCLVTASYANVYFGLRQSIEIDSLRFAIDQIQDEEERAWALGVLVVTASQISSNYAGHFAQPKKVTLGNLAKVLDERSKPVMVEFEVRFVQLAAESEIFPRKVETIEGPWQACLDSLYANGRLNSGSLVYLDAPYKREEYSRYYHVLESLVKYDYPKVAGVGLVPAKAAGRFNSEFFTRTPAKAAGSLAKVICATLETGAACAWSYSDTGIASIPAVVEEVVSQFSCNVRSFATPYVHMSQGQNKVKPVTEHLICFGRVVN